MHISAQQDKARCSQSSESLRLLLFYPAYGIHTTQITAVLKQQSLKNISCHTSLLAPQCMQNLASGLIGCPHSEQKTVFGISTFSPQLKQNFEFDGSSVPHFAHFITETSVLFFVSAVEATAESTFDLIMSPMENASGICAIILAGLPANPSFCANVLLTSNCCSCCHV